MKRPPKKVRVMDIEANGLLETVNKLHCFVFSTLDKQTVNKFRPDEIDKALEFLASCDVIIGHNIISYDFPAIKKVTGYDFPGQKVDTLIMSRMLNPKRIDRKSKRLN